MRYLSAIFFLTVSCSAAATETIDHAEQLKKSGFKYCAGAINTAANWLFDEDAQTLSQWNEIAADQHIANIIYSKKYSQGNAVINLSAAPTALGGCDMVFTATYPSDKACTTIRETIFKDWKFYNDIGGIAAYEDPTSANAQVILNPISNGCLAIKTGMLFFSKDDVKNLSNATPQKKTK